MRVRPRETRPGWFVGVALATTVGCGASESAKPAGAADMVASSDGTLMAESAVAAEPPLGGEEPSNASHLPFTVDELRRATVDGAWWLHRVVDGAEETWERLSVAETDETGVTLKVEGCDIDHRVEGSARLSWRDYHRHQAPAHGVTERRLTRAEVGGEVLDVWVIGDGTGISTYDASLPGPPLRTASEDLSIELFARGVGAPERPGTAGEDARLVGTWTADTAALSRDLAAGPPTTEAVVAAALLGEAVLRITLERGGTFATHYLVGDMDVTTRGQWWTEVVDEDTVVLSTQDDHGCGFPFPVESATIDFDGDDVWMTDTAGLRLRLVRDPSSDAAE